MQRYEFAMRKRHSGSDADSWARPLSMARARRSADSASLTIPSRSRISPTRRRAIATDSRDAGSESSSRENAS